MLELNTVNCGDCLELMKEIPDKYINLILCDMPYGVTACKWDSIISLDSLWAQYKRIIADNGAIVLTAIQPFTTTLIMSNKDMFRYTYVWIKEKATGFARSKKQPMRITEDILVFYKKQPTYDFIGDKLDKPYRHTLPVNKSDSDKVYNKNINSDGSRQYVEYTHKTKDNVLYIPRDNNRNNMHPTQKPVALGQYLIKTYTKVGDIILDNCCGSGSFLLAAKIEKRNFIGIEIDKNYCEISNNRLSKIAL